MEQIQLRALLLWNFWGVQWEIDFNRRPTNYQNHRKVDREKKQELVSGEKNQEGRKISNLKEPWFVSKRGDNHTERAQAKIIE